MKPEVILLPSISPRRKLATRSAFPHAQILQFQPTIEEEEIPDLEKVAQYKVWYAMAELRKKHPIFNTACMWSTTLRELGKHDVHNSKVLAVSADANNIAGGEYFTKPATHQEARKMLSLAGVHGFYDIQAATAIKNGVMVSGTAQSRIVLNEAGKKALMSTGGLDTYLTLITEKFGPNMIFNVSGGIMLEVLLALGWVESIQSNKLQAKTRYETQATIASTQEALHLALMSMVPGVFGLVDKDAQNRLETYAHIDPYMDSISSVI